MILFNLPLKLSFFKHLDTGLEFWREGQSSVYSTFYVEVLLIHFYWSLPSLVCEFLIAVLSDYHNLSGLNNVEIYSLNSGGQNFDIINYRANIRVVTDVLPLEALQECPFFFFFLIITIFHIIIFEIVAQIIRYRHAK